MEQTKAITVEDIEPYILEKSNHNAFGWYNYLYIRGGSGRKERHGRQRHGGEYDFILFYASPEQMAECDYCERKWCEDNNIIYGEGNTILEAYIDYLKKKDDL